MVETVLINKKQTLADRVTINEENFEKKDKEIIEKLLLNLSKDFVSPEKIRLELGKYHKSKSTDEFYLMPTESRNVEIEAIKFHATGMIHEVKFTSDQEHIYMELGYDGLSTKLVLFRRWVNCYGD